MRDWLERNKVFFETLAAVLLSLMAVVIATVQTVVAVKQTHLSELQTRIAEVQALPQFNLVSFVSNDGHRSWVLRNGGAPIHNLEFGCSCFLAVTSNVDGAGIKTIELPFHYCVGSWGSSEGGTGDIANVSGFQTVGEFDSLRNQIVQAAERRKCRDTKVGLHLVVRLQFLDLLDRQTTAFFGATGIAGGRAISDETGKALFARWDTQPHISAFDTADKVFDDFLAEARLR